MSDELRIPIVEEEAHLLKRTVSTEQVRVKTSYAEEEILIRDQLQRGHVAIEEVVRDEEVAEAPPIRTEGEVTIVPVVEERLVISKRLFLVKELHLRRTTQTHEVEVPATLRRTQLMVDHQILNENGEH
jgi:stress response protein YsnF